MALIGGGGAGNVAGGNPSGTGTGLTYIGDHAYAYSGLIVADIANKVLLNFSTANNYIIATFSPIYATDAGDNAEFDIELNGEYIYVSFVAAATTASINDDVNIIIPPYSKIRVLGSVNNDRVLGAIITGRVYG
jgi:hypothetical protein